MMLNGSHTPILKYPTLKNVSVISVLDKTLKAMNLKASGTFCGEDGGKEDRTFSSFE